MFAKPALQMQFVKKPAAKANPTDSKSSMSPDQITKIVKENIKHVAIAGVAVYAAVTTLNTASEIAINAAPKKH